jgi:hypothetical protein
MPQYGPFSRGSTIKFNLEFLDADGDVISPVSAEIHINYQKPNGERGDREATMTQSGSAWVYEWESIEAEAGLVYCYAHTPDAFPPVSSINIRFQLLTNPANQTAKIVDAA